MLCEKYKTEIDDILSRYPVKRSALLPLLYLAQKEEGYVTEAAMKEIAQILKLTPPQVYETITFYTMLNLKPVGKFHIQVCANLSCCLAGARPLIRAFEEKLDIRSGEVTDDGVFSIAEVECLGSCGTAPMLQVNNEPFLENLKPDDVPGILDKLRSRLAEGKR